MKNLTPEMIEKAKAAKSAEELLEVAKTGGIEMTADEAATYFAQLNPKSGELDDDALDNVAGGNCFGIEEPTPQNWDYNQKVRVIDGTTCGKCGGVDGFISSANCCWYVACSKCSTGHMNRILKQHPQKDVDTILI